MVVTQSSAVKTCELLIDGKWVASKAQDFGNVWNPSTGEIIAKVPMCKGDEIDLAVQAAQKAFPAWDDTPVVERARVMYRFKGLLEKHCDSIAKSVSREHGKTFSEAKASVLRGVENIEFCMGIPSLIMGECMENIARSVDCETIRRPLGVCAGIAPFNFPAMVPLWMYPMAITCGNTFVLKPSEKVPLTSMMIAELLKDAGLPDGVLNIIHGGKDAVDAILTHPLIKAVSFVGSTAIAKYIYEVGCKHGKKIQSAGGAKNHVLIMPDADMTHTVQAIIASAYGCAGERCMATAIAIPVGEAAEELVPRLVEAAGKMTVGRTDGDACPDMGPVISAEHLKRIHSLVDRGVKEGAELALDGRNVKVPDAPNGYYMAPTIVDKTRPEMTVIREEIFGPVLSVLRVKTFEEALKLGQECPYGNGAVIYTNSGKCAREFKRRFNAGMIGINVGVPAPMSWFPFTGWNNSFFGDQHIQGREGLTFYTKQKMTMTRWFDDEASAKKFQDPIWMSQR
jgi:malonate-semialdehyde dehydrogenase (acetylating) / methylmalonate-semialdehyde dehydrogenase